MSEELLGDLADFLKDEITVEPWLSQDGFGAETFGPGVTFKTRVRGHHKRVLSTSGEEKVSTVQAGPLPPTPVFSDRDRVTLPARFKPNQPPIIAVGASSDENGPHHQRLMF